LAAPGFQHIVISPDRRYVAGIDHLQKALRIRDLEMGEQGVRHILT
jgi:hypothetical protein